MGLINAVWRFLYGEVNPDDVAVGDKSVLGSAEVL